MKRKLITMLLLTSLILVMTACGNEASVPSIQDEQETTSSSDVDPNEEYVFMMADGSIEYWNQHKNAMYDVTKELGVKYSVSATDSYDPDEMCTLLETVISKRPAGIVIAGYFPEAFTPIFQRAWDEGVPIATTTLDVPNSKRIVFLGTDYFNYGKIMGEQAAQACDGNGKVIISTSLESGQQSQFDMNDGITAILEENYPNVQIVATVEDKADASIGAQVVSSALQVNPDTDVIIGTTAVSALGAVTALRDIDRLGDIKIVAIDRDAPTLENIKDGNIYATVAGKQYAEVYYAVKFLYDYNHNSVPLISDNKIAGVIAQPTYCDPGAIIINEENIDAFLSYDINKLRDPNAN